VYCKREESGEIHEMEEFYPWWWLMREGGAVFVGGLVGWPVIDFTPHIDLLVGTFVVFIPYSFAL
jgi:hypothetical protein